MNTFKKKIIAGILSGAIIFTGGFLSSAQAAENFDGQQQRHERRQFSDEKISEFAKNIADNYGVSQAEVETALKNRTHFEDIKIAATLAKLSGKSFSEVLAMRTDWRQVAEKLGVTREQFEEHMKAEMLEGLAKRSKLDAKTVESLLKEKYNPHDITVAGLIANASGKNVKTVLSKRKINNNWEDIAKEFNVDLNKFKDSERGRGGFDRGNKHGGNFEK